MKMNTCILIASLLLFILGAAYAGCSHCSNGKCNDRNLCNWCIEGRWGAKCGQSCDSFCTACTKEEGRCWKCKDASKFGRNCDRTCSNCIDETQCLDCYYQHSCNDGFHGSYCLKSCPDNCKDGKCNSTSGDCDNGCVDGYYGNTCQYTCRSNCQRCTIWDNCQECKGGFHGSICDKLCPTNCRTCSSYGSCSSCKPMFANLNGIQTCTCSYNICNRRINVHPFTCQSCSSSYWYTTGAYCCPCSHRCMNYSCASDGSCASGCIDGFYGTFCEDFCHNAVSNCKKCTMQQGVALCESCLPGTYLASNNECRLCSSKCVYLEGTISCDSYNGNCTNGCQDGYYFHEGHAVDICQECSENCSGESNSCRASDGYCIYGCRRGHYGLRCNRACPEHCVICDQDTGVCLQCKAAFYGKNCSIACSEQCNDQGCDISTGRCVANCPYGLYGNFCDLQCNEKCLPVHDCRPHCDSNATLCSRDDGYCTYGCRDGAFGQNCSQQCSSFCRNQTCYRTNGTCINGCIEGYTGHTCNQVVARQSGEDDRDTSSGPVIGGGVAAAIIAVAIVIVVLLFIRRRTRNSKPDQFQVVEPQFQNDISKAAPTYTNTVLSDGSPTVPSLSSKKQNINVSNTIYEIPEEIIEPFHMLEAPDEESDDVLDGTSINGYTGDSEETYYNIASTSCTKVAVEDFWVFIRTKTEADFNEEFKRLPKGLVRPHNDAIKPANIGKNRYKLVYPYDDTRVILDTTYGSGDFINASYINGFEGSKQYIASLGPIDKTVNDFWRMVWQENTGKIVMLTNPLENGKMKCITYWPTVGSTSKFSNLSVSTQTEDAYADFIIRQLALEKDKERRTVYQFHFTAWPDRGVPDDVTGLIEFRDKVKSWQALQNGPILVHCSAGIGRTGTFLALDYLTLEGEHDGAVDIFGCLVNMRHQRVGLVQTQEQYRLLHFAVNQSLCPETRPVSSDRFPKYYADISKSKESSMHIKRQFERLDQTEMHSKEDDNSKTRNSAYLTKNRKCGRYTATPAADRYRLRLYLDITDKGPGSDYINAVFIDSHKRKNAYISTQSPLPETMEDFFRLIFQQDISVIVALNEITGKNANVPVYWPAANGVLKAGKFTVDLTETEKMDGFLIRKLTIQYKAKVRTVTQFCATFWTESHQIPPVVETFLRFTEAVESGRHSSPDTPTVVHCLDGTERTGLYCSVVNIIEKLKTGQEVSVANTVRQIRVRRPNAVDSLDQFIFCHEVVLAYLDTFQTYSNMSLC